MGKATEIVLSTEERGTLEAWLRASTTERRYVDRARYILAAAEGQQTKQIAKRFGVRAATVSKWRTRFAEQRLAGLSDAPRPGAKVRYGPETEKRILATLDTPPPQRLQLVERAAGCRGVGGCSRPPCVACVAQVRDSARATP